jgi:CRP-like cAMP-binding protein
MKIVTDKKTDAELLAEIPAFSSCSRTVLEAYVEQGLATVELAERQTFRLPSYPGDNLFVVTAGLALLKAGDGVTVTLEPGDYFGSDVLRRHQHLVASVVAVTDMELVVISADDLARVQRASSKERHPSQIEWKSELRTTVRRKVRLNHRRAVLVRQSA